MHDTACAQAMPMELSGVQAQMQDLLIEISEPSLSSDAPRERAKRGQPPKISDGHLWVSLVWSVLLGMSNYQQWWRLVCTTTLGAFAPVADISADALTTRLQQAGLEPLQRLLSQVSAHLAARLAPLGQRLMPLASFAPEIVAIDESTLDAVYRLLKPLRHLPAGDLGLLPGKLAGRFNLRTQQWELVQYRSEVLGNCKVDVLSLLEGLVAGSLILFDLGYFSFAWFDYLTQMGYYYISRYREKTTYQLIHTYYSHEGILDALVWLGSSRASAAHAGYAVRLVRFWDGKQLRLYFTNVLDPRQLSLAQISHLYARRWDIELAFLTLKEYLGLHHWWSSKRILIVQQIWVVLIVAQLLQALRLEIAAQAQVDPFDVSLPLLVHYVPLLIRQQQPPLPWVLTYGVRLHLIRPSTRIRTLAPDLPLADLHFPPPDLPLVRRACYLQYEPRPHRPSKQQRKPPASTSSDTT